MEKEFIKYGDALALKELGFDEQCLGFYHNEKPNEITFIQTVSTILNTNLFDEFYCSAPLYSQAFRWFREKSFEFYIQHYLHTSVKYYQVYLDYEGGGTVFGKSLTYEEAESACLKKLIEICTNSNIKV